jgi:Leucine-rich repeat (LRR) protein
MNRIDDVTSLSMCILPEIEHLDLSQNHIRTSIPIMQFDNLTEIRLYENTIQSLLFLKETHLLPKLKGIIIHPSELVMLPEEEAKLRSFRFRDEVRSRKIELERRKTFSKVICTP